MTLFKKIILVIVLIIVTISCSYFAGYYFTSQKYKKEAAIAAAELKSIVESNEIFRNEISNTIDQVNSGLENVQLELLKTSDLVENAGSSVEMLTKMLKDLYNINKSAFIQIEELKGNLNVIKGDE